jgi:hypothetical protein
MEDAHHPVDVAYAKVASSQLALSQHRSACPACRAYKRCEKQHELLDELEKEVRAMSAAIKAQKQA